MEFLEESYLRSSDSFNGTEQLISMGSAVSIDELISIYNKVFEEIPNYIYLKGFIPDYWYRPEYWAGHKEYLSIELNQCLNENILLLYKRTVNRTEDFFNACIVNLRLSDDMIQIQNEIVSLQGIYDENRVKKIIADRDASYKLREDMIDLYEESNGFKILLKEYELVMSELTEYGYIYSVREMRFEDEKGIPILTKEELKLVNKLERENYIYGIIGVIFILVVLFFLIYLVVKIL